MNHQDFLQIGEIIGIHGLEGEIKVRPYTDSPNNFFNFDQVLIKDKLLNIISCRVQAGKVYLKLERVTKRSTAEKILGERIYITREQAGDLEEDEFFIVDLIGSNIVDAQSNEKIGTLIDVKQSGVVDNFEIKTDEKIILVPALKEYFKIIDLNTIFASIPEEFFEL